MWLCRAGFSQTRRRVHRDGSRDSEALGGWTTSHPRHRSVAVRRKRRVIDNFNSISYITAFDHNRCVVVACLLFKNVNSSGPDEFGKSGWTRGYWCRRISLVRYETWNVVKLPGMTEVVNLLSIDVIVVSVHYKGCYQWRIYRGPSRTDAVTVLLISENGTVL